MSSSSVDSASSPLSNPPTPSVNGVLLEERPAISSKNNGSGKLPSFNDLLWCPDVDGDVMTDSVGGPVVRNLFLSLKTLFKEMTKTT